MKPQSTTPGNPHRELDLSGFSEHDLAILRARAEEFARIDEPLAQAVAAAFDLWPGDPTVIEYCQARIEEIAKPHIMRGPSRERNKAKIMPSLRKRVFERDAYRCRQCGDWHDLHLDHIIPESKGGPTTFENLQVLCGPCNLRKGARA